MTRRLRSFGPTVAGILVLAAVAVTFLGSGTGENDSGSPSTSPPPAEEKLAATQALLSGTVSDARTKLPLPGAALSIEQAEGTLAATADGEGRYRAIIDASRPIAITVDAPQHRGTVIFGRLCPGERRTLPIELPAAEPGTPPPSPVIIGDECPG